MGTAAIVATTVALCGLATAGAADVRPGPPAADAPRGSFVSGAVTWALPEGWLVQGFLEDCASEGVAVFIPCPHLEATGHSANANLLALPNAEGEDLASWSARRLAVAAPRRIVEDRTEGAWRTVVSAGEDQGARYVVVERFGATPRARVHAVAAFPSPPLVPEGWLARTGADVARFLDALALADAPPPEASVAVERGSVRLAPRGR